MDPSGEKFTYDKTGPEDAPASSDEDIYDDEEMIFDQFVDEEHERDTDGIMMMELGTGTGTAAAGAGTIATLPPPVHPDRRQHTKIIICCMLFFIVVLAVLAAVLTIELQEKEEIDVSSLSRKERLMNLLTSEGVSFDELLVQFSTPEGQALAFLAEEDWDGDMKWFYQDFDSNSKRIIERYVLALIYFNCDGKDWFHSYNFLTPQDHCDWNAIFQKPGEEATIEGVTGCTKDKHVQRLYFRKCNVVRIRGPAHLQRFILRHSQHLQTNHSLEQLALSRWATG